MKSASNGWSGTGPFDALLLGNPTWPHVHVGRTWIIASAKLTSCHCKPKHSDIRRPVPAAKSVRVRSVRALEQMRPAAERLFEDPIATTLAGTHGTALAERFCSVAPQIQPMVAARTRHLDDLVSRIHDGQPCQRPVQIVRFSGEEGS